MAEEKFNDLTKVNLYGATDEQLRTLQKSQEEAIEALNRRFVEPNWLKVSAAFAKPQLGGFGASWGSAMNELGETEEKRRESMLPVAQMRAQLAQTNMLLGNKQKAAEIIARAQTEKRMLTPTEQEEVSNLDPVRGQQLIQSQDVRAKTVANNMALTKQQYEARGLPMPPLNEMGLPDTGKFPVGGGNDQTDPGRLVPQNDVTTLPSGARVNEDQRRLHELGVPIISGVRTQEEQNALKHHQDENGKWFTKDNLPVADVSKHTSGNAIDVDVNKLTDEHRGILKAMGYTQPFSNDKGHWEKAGAKPSVNTTSGQQTSTKDGHVVLQFMPDTSPTNPYGNQAELTKQQLLEQNKEYHAQFSSLNKAIGPTSALGNRALSASNSLMSQLSYDPNENYVGKDGKTHNAKEEQLQRIIGQLSQGGWANAAMAAAAKGVGVSTPLGAAEINIPFDTFLKKLPSKEDQAVAEKIIMNLATLQLWQQQHTGQSLGGMPIKEFDLIGGASPSHTMTLSALRYGTAKAHNNIDNLKKMQEEVEDIVNGTHSKYKLSAADKPIAYYSAYNSPAMRGIRNSYMSSDQEIDSMFEDQERKERRARQGKR